MSRTSASSSQAGALDPTSGHRGQSHPRRRDGYALLTGGARFVDDVALPGMCHAALVRSRVPRARIESVDSARAEAMPGVVAVLTGEQAAQLVGPLPHFFDPTLVGCRTSEVRCLAVGEVRWVGEPVAIMVAETLAQAEAARDAVVVHDEPQPAVLDAESALAPDAPLLYPEWEDNVLGRFPFGEGDAEQVMHDCPHVLEGELRVGRHQCAPLETRGYVADWRPPEGLHVWASTQNPHHVRSHLAAVLSMPEHRVHVTAPNLGGGFGHKFAGYAEEYLVALLSRQLGRPVKWIETREESLLVGAREFTHRFRAGYDDEGQVLALTDHMIANVGG